MPFDLEKNRKDIKRSSSKPSWRCPIEFSNAILKSKVWNGGFINACHEYLNVNSPFPSIDLLLQMKFFIVWQCWMGVKSINSRDRIVSRFRLDEIESVWIISSRFDLTCKLNFIKYLLLVGISMHKWKLIIEMIFFSLVKC